MTWAGAPSYNTPARNLAGPLSSRETGRLTLKKPSLSDWNRIGCAAEPLDLSATLSSGQSFRWRRDVTGIWWGVVGQMIMALWQKDGGSSDSLYWQTFPRTGQRALVEDYFRLDVPLDALYSSWIQAEPRMREVVSMYRGLRILRQPSVECFFGFQCATCNTVVKIERTVHRLATRYGLQLDLMGETSDPFDSVPGDGPPPLFPPLEVALPFYSFPDLDALADADESDLRADLWGFRAPRVIALARRLRELGANWLPGLRGAPYLEAKTALVALDGIGQKVADCICLFCLDMDEAVPVDTHVRKTACRLFLPELQEKSLTPRVYAAIASAYQERFGSYAGWAQQYLFLGALRGL